MEDHVSALVRDFHLDPRTNQIERTRWETVARLVVGNNSAEVHLLAWTSRLGCDNPDGKHRPLRPDIGDFRDIFLPLQPFDGALFLGPGIRRMNDLRHPLIGRCKPVIAMLEPESRL